MTTQPTNTNSPTNQLERNAANWLRTTMAAVRLAFTWFGVRKTLAPEQRTTAAKKWGRERLLLRGIPRQGLEFAPVPDYPIIPSRRPGGATATA
jgi:hypothetical protein